MSNIAFLFLPLAFSSLPAVLPFVSPSSEVLFGSAACLSTTHRFVHGQALRRKAGRAPAPCKTEEHVDKFDNMLNQTESERCAFD